MDLWEKGTVVETALAIYASRDVYEVLVVDRTDLIYPSK